MVTRGERPQVESTDSIIDDPTDSVLRKAMDMCFIHNPSERSSASEVLDYLSKYLEGINPQRGNFLENFHLCSGLSEIIL